NSMATPERTASPVVETVAAVFPLQAPEYAPLEERIARAKAYVAKVPPAISGQHGHDRTYHVAALLVRDFALREADSLPIMEEFKKRCKPPWTPDELVRKLREADKKDGPRGCKAGKTDPEKLAEARRYVMRSGRFDGPNGLRKQEHAEVARILLKSFDLFPWE